MWCLPSYLADKFLEMIKDGTITPEKLIAMGDKGRRAFFAEHFGEENAQKLNAAFESKLLLKNQQKGIVTWAKRASGITPEAKRGLVNRANKMTEVLTPETEEDFLADLAEQAMGTTVTMEEAGNIATLAKEVDDQKGAMEKGPRREIGERWTEGEQRYGRALIAFDNYVNAIKADVDKTTISEKALAYLKNPFSFVSDLIQGIASSSREFRTTLDNSFIGKQGRDLFFKGLAGDFQSGKIWLDSLRKSYSLLYNTFTGARVMDELNAEIISDPQYDMMKKAKVALFTVEEEMPSDWHKNVPYIGRPFEAAHNAYVGTAHYMRYRLAQQYLKMAKDVGVELDKEGLESLGKLTNSLTGRGYIASKGEGPTLIDNLFFSRRLLKADWDKLTAHAFDKKMSKFAKKQAAINLGQIIAGQAIVLGIASIVLPGCVELDPKSADFGKIKVGNTRYDVSGGVGSMLRLAVRLLPLMLNKNTYIKSTTTGKKIKLNTGKYGSMTGLDVLEEFTQNKAAPIAAVVMAHLEGHYRFRRDEKPTLVGDIRELYLPLPIENVQEVLEKGDENAANTLAAILADWHGAFTQTYESKRRK